MTGPPVRIGLDLTAPYRDAGIGPPPAVDQLVAVVRAGLDFVVLHPDDADVAIAALDDASSGIDLFVQVDDVPVDPSLSAHVTRLLEVAGPGRAGWSARIEQASAAGAAARLAGHIRAGSRTPLLLAVPTTLLDRETALVVAVADQVAVPLTTIAEAQDIADRLRSAAEGIARPASALRVLAELEAVVDQDEWRAIERAEQLWGRRRRQPAASFIGSAEHFAHALAAWSAAEVVDGFLLSLPDGRASLEAMTAVVMPTLAAHGLVAEPLLPARVQAAR